MCGWTSTARHVEIADPSSQSDVDVPVRYDAEAGAWIVRRYVDAVEVLRDTSRFSSINSLGIEAFSVLPAEVQSVLDDGYSRFPGIVEMDPPAHTRYRSLINLAFTPRRVVALEPRVRQIVVQLIGEMAASKEVEFVAQFAFPLPMIVISEVLGVPPEDSLHVQTLTNDFRALEAGTLSQLPLDEQLRCARSFVAFQRYAAKLIKKRRAKETDDVLGALVASRLDDGRELATAELVSMVIHLLFAGQETTVMLLGSLMWLLMKNPDQWEKLCARPQLATSALEEALRLEPPVTYHLRRTTEAVRLAGVDVPAGADVRVVFATANLDDQVFSDPTRFDIERSDVGRHLSFGRGIHFCVGAPLARLEARIVFEELAARLPGLKPASGNEAAYSPHRMLHGLSDLRLTC
jgi:cytochrome P450